MTYFLVYHFCLRSLVPLERCETEQIETNFGGLWRRRVRGLHGLDWCHPNILWHCVDRHRELLPLDIRNSILGWQRFSRELASNAGHQLHFQASKKIELTWVSILFTTEYKLRNSYYFLTIFPNVILLFSRIWRGFISNKLNNSYLNLCFWYKVTAIPKVTCIR